MSQERAELIPACLPEAAVCWHSEAEQHALAPQSSTSVPEHGSEMLSKEGFSAITAMLPCDQ